MKFREQKVHLCRVKRKTTFKFKMLSSMVAILGTIKEIREILRKFPVTTALARYKESTTGYEFNLTFVSSLMSACYSPIRKSSLCVTRQKDRQCTEINTITELEHGLCAYTER